MNRDGTHDLLIIALDMEALTNHTRHLKLEDKLSKSPCKKKATMWQGMQKGASFCTTLLLFYHTSDWLNQQNVPKLQVHCSCIFIYP